MTPLQSSARYSEDASVEQPAIELFKELGWNHINAFHETFGANGTLGRETKAEVFLTRLLRPAIERLNPGIPPEGVEAALTEVTRDRSTLHNARANREVYELLRDRVPVMIRKPDGSRVTERVTVIDWETPENNDFLLVSQFWVTGDLYERRADLVGFVNGIPLVFIELKAAHRNLKHAYDDNLRDYRDDDPPALLAQRLHHPLEWSRDQGRHDHVGLGALPRVEEDQLRGRGGPCLARDRDPGDVHAGASARHRRELHGLPGVPGGPGQARRQEPPVPRREQRAARLQRAPRPTTTRTERRRSSASSGTRRGRARASRWSSSRRRSCARCRATGRSSSSPTATTSTTRSYKDVRRRGRRRASTRVPRSTREHLRNAADRGPPLRLHADPEVPDRAGRDVSGALATATTSSSSPTRHTAPSTTRSR